MRPLPLTFVSLAALLATAGIHPPRAVRGQGGGEKCPAITVTCSDLVMSGTPTLFTANVSGGDDKVMPTFEWEVSAGTIISGQGESALTVDTTGLAPAPTGREMLTATVKLGGYAPECRAAASCTTEVYVIIDYFKTDEYGPISFADEKARLDNYAIELRNDPTVVGYVICYGGRRGRRGEAQARCARAKHYLVARHKIPAGRVVTVDGGYMEQLTVMLWPLPPGVKLWPSPTVDPSEVEFLPEPTKRKGRRTKG